MNSRNYLSQSFRLATCLAGLSASVTLAGAATTLTLSPTTLSFPVTTTGNTSVAENVTVTNTGTTAISITKISLLGSNVGDFAISTKTCTTSLAVGASCTVSLTFSPLASGIRVASLVVTDNATGSPQSVALQGTAESATQGVSFFPTSIAFPATTIGTISNNVSTSVTNFGTATVTFTGVHLQGTNDGDFAITGNSCTTVAQGASCTVSVSFSPTASGIRQASLQFTDTATGSPQTVPIVGTAQSVALSIGVSPTSFSFGTVNVGTTTSSNYFSVSNSGNAAVTYTSATLTGTNAADFAITSQTTCANGGTLNPNNTCYVYVTFTPSATGVRTATLNIADNATGSPQTVTLYGVGQTATSNLSFTKGNLDLGVESLNTTSAQIYVGAEATGTTPVTFTSVSLGGTNASDFAITSNGCTGTLNFSQLCYTYVTFTPLAAGQRTATLNFTDSGTGSPQSVSLTGTGETQIETLALNYLDYGFGSIVVGATSSAYYESIYNAGDAPLTFSSIAIAGTNAPDFTITSNNCPVAPATLTVGQTCYVYVTFSPSAAGVRSASLQLTDTGTGSPQIIGLGGLGLAQAQTLTFSAPSLVFPGVVVGSSTGQQYVAVTNTGDNPVTFNSVTVTGSGAAAFVEGSNGCTGALAPAQTCYVYIASAPSTAGVQSASLSFNDTAAGSPQAIALAGDGEPASPALSGSVADVNFGYGVVGVSSPTTHISLTNNSASAITIAFQVVGPNAADFVVTGNTCTGSLPGSGTCSLNVAFDAAAVGARTGALRFTVASVAQDILLSGIGSASSKLLTLQSAIDFGTATIATSSRQDPVSIQNTGGVPVSITSYTIAGADPADFSVASNTCGAALAPNVICDVYLIFTPTAAGIRTATLQVADSATGSPQSVALSGVGQNNVISLSLPPAVDFGTTVTGSPLNSSVPATNTGTSAVTITHTSITGANASDFLVDYNPCTLINPDSECTLTVSFNPSAPGVRTATMNLTDNATGSPQSVSLVGVAQASVATVSLASALAFPSVALGTYSSQYFNVQNSGTIPVTVTAVTVTGVNAADFSVYNVCQSIAAGATCSLQVIFAPSASGLRVANLNIADNVTGSPQRVALTGIGQASNPSFTFPQDLAFPPVTTGSYLIEYAPIYNNGNVVITFTSLAITGTNASDFLVLGGNCTQINPNAGCNIYVAFVPTGSGTRSANLVFTDNATGSPQSLLLTGIGQGKAASAALTPSSITFAAQTVGTVSGGQYLYVTNNGAVPVTVSKVSISGANPTDFQIVSSTCAAAVLNQNQYCYVEVQFEPTATGARAATLTAIDNGVGGSQTATLTGTGQ